MNPWPTNPISGFSVLKAPYRRAIGRHAATSLRHARTYDSQSLYGYDRMRPRFPLGKNAGYLASPLSIIGIEGARLRRDANIGREHGDSCLEGLDDHHSIS